MEMGRNGVRQGRTGTSKINIPGSSFVNLRRPRAQGSQRKYTFFPGTRRAIRDAPCAAPARSPPLPDCLPPDAPTLLARYERPLLAFACHHAGDPETARDAVQDTFLRYFRDRPSGDLESVAPWLFTVCRRLLIDHQRKNHRIVPMNAAAALTLDTAIDETTAPPDSATERKDDTTRLRTLMKSLPERQRELVRLKFEAGLSYRDIAAATGLTVTNVGTLLHHAVQSLREQFHAV
jgi:RNA polymerase sigma factor (sigma-70 family)